MGMFDSVYVFCPNCGDEVEFQSKAGECVTEEYYLHNMPAEIARDICGDSLVCSCGKILTLMTPRVVSVADN